MRVAHLCNKTKKQKSGRSKRNDRKDTSQILFMGISFPEIRKLILSGTLHERNSLARIHKNVCGSKRIAKTHVTEDDVRTSTTPSFRWGLLTVTSAHYFPVSWDIRATLETISIAFLQTKEQTHRNDESAYCFTGCELYSNKCR